MGQISKIYGSPQYMRELYSKETARIIAKLGKPFLIKASSDVERPVRPTMICYKCRHMGPEDEFIDLQADDLNCPRCHSRNISEPKSAR